MSTRRDDAHGVPDNQVTALLYNLPVQIADPVERLKLVHDEMTELKASHMDSAGAAVTSLGNLAPPMVVGPLSRMASRAMHQLPQRSVNTVTTNVPGPQYPLYCLGREMLEYRPYVPVSHGVRVGTAILSYNGHLAFGITGDYATARDVGVVASAITDDIEELRQRALAPSSCAPAATKAKTPPAKAKRSAKTPPAETPSAETHQPRPTPPIAETPSAETPVSP